MKEKLFDHNIYSSLSGGKGTDPGAFFEKRYDTESFSGISRELQSKGQRVCCKGRGSFWHGVSCNFRGSSSFCCRVSFFTGKRGDWHAVCAADGDTDFRKCAVVSGAFVPESDLSKDRIPVRGRGAVGGVRPVSHRAWGGQMAVFSGYVECKGHSVLQ